MTVASPDPSARRAPSAPVRTGAIIVAAGSSSRMAGVNKTFAVVAGRSLLAHSIAPFQDSPLVDAIVLVMHADYLQQAQEIVATNRWAKVIAVCPGGQRRQDSVRLGLERLPRCEWVLVHDGARPCADAGIIERGLQAARETGAAVCAVPVKDTIKQVSPAGMVEATPPRDALWAVQTPQVFRYGLLREAHAHVTQDVTDDAAMVELCGGVVKVFMGSYANIKVTTPEDLLLADTLLRQRTESRH